MTQSDQTITIELPVPTASIVLAELMRHDAVIPVDVQTYSWGWHIRRAREALKTALQEWGR